MSVALQSSYLLGGLPRPLREVNLPREPGVYALYLRTGDALPIAGLSVERPIYVGRAVGCDGLAGRCHFEAQTTNHSPRKSLAVVLMQALDLNPVPAKGGGRGNWTLDARSEGDLTAWMHENLNYGFDTAQNPKEKERELILLHEPLLNLTICTQTVLHRRIKEMRDEIRNRMKRN